MKTVELYTDEEFEAKWPEAYFDGPRLGEFLMVYRERIPCGRLCADGDWKICNLSLFNKIGPQLPELDRAINALTEIRAFILSDGRDLGTSRVRDKALTA